ncbi:hypothetical protein cyc_03616 [Cyclospora cayetanensis]|uniref:Ubiquitin-like domain-containing protein n=1 Tax=Cyclospora cayetanensis TaxID=88456 RepID=A0A1D3D9Q7_9EIME|nr:hypothetical protein cyc_03616 [Cyclospora cayetanensis]
MTLPRKTPTVPPTVRFIGAAVCRVAKSLRQKSILLLLLLLLHDDATHGMQIYPQQARCPATRRATESREVATAATASRHLLDPTTALPALVAANRGLQQPSTSISSLLLLRGGNAVPRSHDINSQVRVSVVTATGVKCLDRQWELLLPSSSTIEEVQHALQQMLQPPPPLTLLRLLHGGRLLSRDETLQQLMQADAFTASAASEDDAASFSPAAAVRTHSKRAVSLIWDIAIPPAPDPDTPGDAPGSSVHSSNICSDSEEIAAYIAAGDTAGRIAALLQQEADILAREGAPSNASVGSTPGQDQKLSAVAAAAINRAAYGGSDDPLQSSEELSATVQTLQKSVEPHEQKLQHREGEEVEFFPSSPRTLGDYVKRQLLLQVQGRGWRIFRHLLPSAAAALLEDAEPIPLDQQEERDSSCLALDLWPFMRVQQQWNCFCRGASVTLRSLHMGCSCVLLAVLPCCLRRSKLHPRWRKGGHGGNYLLTKERQAATKVGQPQQCAISLVKVDHHVFWLESYVLLHHYGQQYPSKCTLTSSSPRSGAPCILDFFLGNQLHVEGPYFLFL